MAAIRNARVASGALVANTTTTVFVVPANYALLLKSVIMLSGGATTADTYYVYLASGSIYVELASGNYVGTQGNAQWNGWVALNAGDAVQLRASQATNYWLSGALLPYNPSI